MEANEKKLKDASVFFSASKVVSNDDNSVLSSSFANDLSSQLMQRQLSNLSEKSLMDKIKTKFSNKKIFLFGGLAAFTVIAVILGTVLLINSKKDPFKNDPTSTEIGANLTYLEGSVEYFNGQTWASAVDEMDLYTGYGIRTSDDSRVIVTLDDGSVLRLDKNSEMALTSLDPDHILITNVKGSIYSRVIKAERDFEVVVDKFNLKSLGTAYKTINEENVKAVEVYHSEVQILGLNINDEILVTQGNKYYLYNAENPEEVGKLIEVNIEDVKQDEFVVWNKEQDEVVEEFKSQMGVLFDLVPPTLTVTEPSDAFKTTNESVAIKGTTEAGAQVLVNGISTSNNNGSFEYSFDLNIGANGIKVESIDAAGNKTIVNLTITREEPAPTSTPKPTNPPTQAKITLYGTVVDGGISFTWNVQNVSTPNGFKLVKSETANPVYPGNDYQYISESGARSYTWGIKDGKTYHFRVCQYIDGKCGVYSNDITVKAPVGPTSTPKPTQIPVSSISLSSAGGTAVNWSVVGYSTNGFKIVWSKNSNPTYPTRSGDKYDYKSDPGTRSYSSLDAFDGAGTYYVRVCEYLGGSCGVYSNQIQVNLE